MASENVDGQEVSLDGPKAYLMGFGSVPMTTAFIDAGNHDYFPSGEAYLRSVLRSSAALPAQDDYSRGRYDAARSALGL